MCKKMIKQTFLDHFLILLLFMKERATEFESPSITMQSIFLEWCTRPLLLNTWDSKRIFRQKTFFIWHNWSKEFVKNVKACYSLVIVQLIQVTKKHEKSNPGSQTDWKEIEWWLKDNFTCSNNSRLRREGIDDLKNEERHDRWRDGSR